MSAAYHNTVQFVLSGWLAGALAASALAQSVSEKSLPAGLHGEPIDAPKPSQTLPEAAAKATLPSSEMKTGSVAAPKATTPSASGTALPLDPVTAPNPAVTNATGTGSTAYRSNKAGYLIVSFEKLASFEFEPPDTQITNRTAAADEADKLIPADIRSLDGKKVVIRGFMLPLKVEVEKATEFLLMRNQGACCFGTMPKMTELVSVITKGKGVEPILDQPVSIIGTLHVGTLRDNGYVVGLYRMDGEKMVDDPEH
jgi:hypothetical protein